MGNGDFKSHIPTTCPSDGKVREAWILILGSLMAMNFKVSGGIYASY